MPPTEVLLIAGGAVSSTTGFPGLQLDAPVLALDRPGVVTNPSSPTHLSEQATWIADQLGPREPVIVVAHSLGGPVAVQLAADHPSLVAGLVLLDPTPFNDAKLVKRTVAGVVPFEALMRVPLLGKGFGAVATRSHRKDPLLAQAAAEMVEPGQWTALRSLLTHFSEDAALLTSRLEASPLRLPGLVATADRKPTSPVTRAHHRMANLTGLRVEMWPGTTHTQHFERQQLVAAAVATISAGLQTGPTR